MYIENYIPLMSYNIKFKLTLIIKSVFLTFTNQLYTFNYCLSIGFFECQLYVII